MDLKRLAGRSLDEIEDEIDNDEIEVNELKNNDKQVKIIHRKKQFKNQLE